MKPNLSFLLFSFFFLLASHSKAQSQLKAGRPQSVFNSHSGINAVRLVINKAHAAAQNPLAASFDQPSAIASDGHGGYYIGEAGHDIRKIDSKGVVSLFAGSDTAGYKDGPRSIALFGSVPGIAVDTSGNLFVTDGSNALIRKIDTAGMVTTLAGNLVQGNKDGKGPGAKFSSPSGITIDRSGNLYVTDQVNNNIRKITPDGSVTTIAGGVAGYVDSTGINASFNKPMGICVDTLGNLFVADYGNNRIRKITPDGHVSTFAGSGLAVSHDAAGVSAGFDGPSGLFLDSAQNLYVVENNKVREIRPDGFVATRAGSGQTGDEDGQALSASFNMLTGIYVNYGGVVYLTDSDNQKIREICSGDIVSTLAGTGSTGTANGSIGSLINPDCPAGKPVITPIDTCHLVSIIIPNVFTPNGDNINDHWKIQGLNSYPNCDVLIFDRYGQMVFRNKGYKIQWDGTYGGKPVPAGLYYYLVTNLCKFLYGYVAVIR